tara:strand:- start:662 stop:1318 length:657 start_codon:yes stop_codon:yes gene_type:complete
MKTALVFGSTGLIGGHILSLLINNNNYNKIKIFVRSSPSNLNEKVDVILTDFLNLNSISSTINGDDCFFSIGTTKKKSPDKNEYRRIEYNIPVEIAKIAKANSVNNFSYVSSGYADHNHSSAYLKNKGDVEILLQKLNFSKLAIMRPSFLLGNRKEFRIGETIGSIALKTLSPILLGKIRKIRPIKAETVAKAMIIALNSDNNKNIFESDQIEELVLN